MLTSHHGITTATVSEQASLEAVNEANQPVATCDGNNPFPVLIGADIAFAMEELLLVTCEPLTQRAQLD